MFIRTKKINGILYSYLVENKKIGRHIKQKTVRYLGKTYDLNKNKKESLEEHPKKRRLKLKEYTFDEILESYLSEFGFRPRRIYGENVLFNKDLDVIINLKKMQVVNIKRKKKDIEKNNERIYIKNRCVLKVNQGYICDYTLKNLEKAYKNCKECNEEELYDNGKNLVKAIIDLGINVDPNDFKEFFLRITESIDKI